jgi:predicted O-methyltransferase YrrM
MNTEHQHARVLHDGVWARLRKALPPLGRLNSLHYVAYRLGLAQPRTETSAAERECLRRHAAGKRRLAEIGVFQGVNTRTFRTGMHPDGVLLAVDPYPRFFFGIRGFGWARRIAHREVGRARNGRVVWVECRGQDAPAKVEVRPFLPVDFLFIDGDHGYEGLRGDWEAWREHIAPGGIVALHDSRNRRGRGAERFTQEVIRQDPDFVLLEEVDSLTVLRRHGPEKA